MEDGGRRDVYNFTLIMLPPGTESLRQRHYVFELSVSACLLPSVRSCVLPVSTVSYKPVDGISPNFG